jgi:surfeit locus 1 family protein
MLLGPRVRDGVNGYHVVTPLVRADGSTVIVDRGFIPKDNVDLERRSRTQDTVQVLGLLRTTHTRNNFTPTNLPDVGVWYWVDLDAMAEYAGGTKAGVQPVYVEEVFGGSIHVIQYATC